MSPKKEFRLNDESLSDVLLGTREKKQELNTPENHSKDDKKQSIKRKKLIRFTGYFLLLLSVFLFFALMTGRRLKKNIAISTKVKQAEALHQRFNECLQSGSSSSLSYSGKIALADSLILMLNILSEDYPKEKEIKRLWALTALQRYGIEFMALISQNRTSEIDPPDTPLLERINDVDTVYSGIANVFRHALLLEGFRRENPLAPYMAVNPPKRWTAEIASLHGDSLALTVQSNLSLLSIYFGDLLDLSRILTNDALPSAKTWLSFWNAYEKLSMTQDEQEEKRIKGELLAQFPRLTVLSGGDNIPLFDMPLSIGIASSSYEWCNDIETEWQPVISRLSKAIGMEVKLMVFKTEEEALSAFTSRKVDMAVLDVYQSSQLLASGMGSPVAMRQWDGQTFIPFNLLTFSNSDIVSLENAKGKKGIFSGNVTSPDFLIPYNFFSKRVLTLPNTWAA
jgi:hypothetical protein